MKRFAVLSLIVFASLLVAQDAHASTYRVNRRPVDSGPWLRERSWTGQAGGKLLYGLKNTLFGWTEILTEPYAAATAKNGNIVAGVGKGIWNAVGQTVGGAVDMVTFPFTTAVVPLPQGGTSVI